MVSCKSESTWDVVIKVGFFKALSIRRTLSLITKVVVKKKNNWLWYCKRAVLALVHHLFVVHSEDKI
jgi:hypothetical protein